MDQLIAIKWSQKDTYRAKLSIDDLFDPTTNYSPVHGEIFAKLQATTAMTSGSVTWESMPGAALIEIRMPGSKIYERLDKQHRDGTVKAGRARLRVVGGTSTETTPMLTLKSSATSNFSTTATDYEHCPDLLKVFLEAGSNSKPVELKPVLKQPVATTDAPELSPFGIGLAQTPPATEWKSFSKKLSEPFTKSSFTSSEEPLTRAEVNEMIENKLAEFSKNLATTSRLTSLTDSTTKQPGMASYESDGRADDAVKSAITYRHNAICDACDDYIVGVRWKCLGCPDFDSCEGCRDRVQAQHSTHRFIKITDDAIVRAVGNHKTAYHAGVLCDGPLCKDRKTPISGDRYKCSICADYDHCTACEVHPENKHNSSHPMIKMKKPISKVEVTVKHEDNKAADDDVDLERAQARSVPVVDFPFEELHKRVVTPTEEFRDAFANIGAKVRQAITQKGKSLRVVKHLTVACDSCNQMVRGSRFMCATCADFDLCQACYGQSLHDSSHVFVRYNHFINNIVTPRLKIDAVTAQDEQTQGKPSLLYSCDECNTKPQSGKRYNCLVCEDYDACEGCKDVHLNSHPMQIIPAFQAQRSKKSTLKEEAPAAKTDLVFEAIVPTDEDALGSSSAQDIGYLTQLSADYVEDISIPDSTTIDVGAQFVKQWLVKNDGNVPWPAGVKAACVGGAKLTAVSAFDGKEILTETETVVHPGQSAVISAFLQAPKEDQDNVVSYFRLFTPQGMCFGCSLWVDIDVKANSRARSGDNIASESDEHQTAASTDPAGSHVESTSTAESTMIFPSASMELTKVPLSSIDSQSATGTQRGESWGSESEVVLSDDEDDYDVLDNESFVGDE